MAGYIKLFRKFAEWEWYQDANVTRVFLHLLLTANYEDKRWQGKSVGKGQIVVGRKRLAEALNLTEQNIRTALEKLESTGEITREVTNKYTLITICNYVSYQSTEEYEQPTNNQQITNNQPTINQQVTTTKEYKEDNNISLSYAREERFFAGMKEPNTEWQVLACMKLGLTVETLSAMIADFELECKARMLTHVSDADARSHFVTWAKKELERDKQTKTSYGTKNKQNNPRGEFEPTPNADYSAPV